MLLELEFVFLIFVSDANLRETEVAQTRLDEVAFQLFIQVVLFQAILVSTRTIRWVLLPLSGSSLRRMHTLARESSEVKVVN